MRGKRYKSNDLIIAKINGSFTGEDGYSKYSEGIDKLKYCSTMFMEILILTTLFICITLYGNKDKKVHDLRNNILKKSIHKLHQ